MRAGKKGINTSASVTGTAGFSRCRRYRYWLRRHWDPLLPQCAFIGLNPSTASARSDDPTLRRCLNFAKDWGYGSLLIVNLFAYRATDSRELERVADPVGARTNLWLRRARAEADLIVAAWGNGGQLLGRAKAVETWLGDSQCLGVTAQGMPRHPLYCARTAGPKPWLGTLG